MNKLITKQGAKLLAVAAGFVLFSFSANAQDLVNSKKINNVTGGVIRFNNDNGKFTNNNANTAEITNDGTIQMMGTDNSFDGTTPLATATARVPGLVSYADDAVGNQNIFPGYYTNLDMADAATKQFGAGLIFIGGNYTTAGGDRVYGTSTVTYDGGTGTTGATAQTIAAENTGNGGGYNNIEFTEDGLKTLSTGTALVNGTTNIAASTSGGGVTVDGATSVFTASGNLTQVVGAGDFSINNTGTVNVNGATNTIGANTTVNSGTINFGDGTNASATTVTGALNLTDASGLSDLALNNSGTLNINGAFTNADQARTNMTYDAGSTIDYQDGATNIITTVNSNPYGAFIISKSNGAIVPTNSGGTNNNIEIATSFAMNGGSGNNLDMLNNGNGYVNILSGTANNVTYTNNEEVVGEFRRTHAVVTGQDYLFNNSASIVNYATAPTGGNYFAMIVNPDGQTDSYDATRDIKRDINLDYDYTAWVADITAGYQFGDVNEDGLWDASYNQNQIRFREGDATPLDEKISTGNPYTRSATAAAGTLGSVSLAGFTPTTNAVDGLADDEFFAGNDLILRAGPAIWYSVNPGRWSNPATWDEGVEPPTDAEVVVRHNVHAGFIRPIDNFTTDEATPGAMATKITIQEPNATFPTPTLMIGSSDIVGTFATSTAIVAGITNPGRVIVENVTTPVLLPDYVNEEVTNNNSYVDGLVIFSGAEFTASESLINDGCVNVGGILGIGQP